jgi:phosphoglycolate phosphatase
LQTKVLLFDFDGTLADSLAAGVEIFNALSQEFNFLPIEPENLAAARAMPARQLMKAHGIPLAAVPIIAARGLKLLRSRMESIQPFPGIPAALTELRSMGFILGILTSNSRENVEIFLQRNEITVFDFISPSSRLFGKAHDLRKILRRKKWKPEEMVYLGDECRDLEAASEAGIPAIGVTWGYNTAPSLAALAPAALLNHPEEIPRFFTPRGTNPHPA